MKKVLLSILVLFTFLLVGCKEEKPEIEIILEEEIIVHLDEIGFISPKVEGIDNPIFNYDSNNDDIFTITENGEIIPVALGEGNVGVSISNISQIYDVKVIIIEPKTNLSFSNTNLNMYVNEKLTLELLANNVPYTGEIIWEVDNEGMASIDQGIVTALMPGSVTITAKVGALSKSIVILVEDSTSNEQISQITISGLTTVEVQMVTTLVVTPDVDKNFSCLWTSSNELVATVSNGGVVTGVSEGSAMITATLVENPSINATYEITVTKQTLKVSATPSDTMYVEAVGVSFIIKNSRGLVVRKYDCNFSSSNESVISVTTAGIVEAKSAGTAEITVTYNGIIGTITLTVLPLPIENVRNSIIAIALSQNGYVEGIDNENKYGEWYGMNNAAWCAIFVSWCANQAQVSVNIIPKYALVVSGRDWYIQKGASYYKTYEQVLNNEYIPIAGDIIFFTSNGASHTGLVVKMEGDLLYTIEGNTSDSVRLRYYYYKTYDKITGFGIPAYTKSQTPIQDFDVTAATFGGGVSTN